MKKTILLISIFLISAQLDSAQEIPLVYSKFKYISPDDMYYSQVIPEKFKGLVMNAAAEYGIPLPILVALIWSESRYDENALNFNSNGTYDEGLLQLNSANYYEFKQRFNNNKDYNPNDPQQNIRIGCKYLIWIYNNPKIGKGKWFNTIVFWNGSKKSSIKLAKFVLGYR